MSSWKPIDSISSHSSSTAHLTRSSFSVPRRRWSSTRPGVPHTIWPPALEHLDLAAHRRAAVDRHHHQPRVRGDARQLGGHLQRQLARRQQHQRLHELVAGVGDAVRERDAEGGGLARPGARLNHQVAPLHDRRQRLGLHQHRLGEAHLFDRAQHLGAQPELGERRSLFFQRRAGAERPRRPPPAAWHRPRRRARPGSCRWAYRPAASNHSRQSPSRSWGPSPRSCESCVFGCSPERRAPISSRLLRMRSSWGAWSCPKRSSSLV